jgi:shikimate kinase
LITQPKHATPTRNIALVGGRGCGKSSVAKRLALCNKHFMLFSLDALIRYEAGGLSIPEIVERDGWARFRELEWYVVQRAAAFQSGAVLDCGGGVVVDLDPMGREMYSERKVGALREHTLIVYLWRGVEALQAKVENDPNRPSLSESESFREIIERRDPWYRQAADLVVDCTDLSKVEITNRVLAWYYDRLDLGEAPRI